MLIQFLFLMMATLMFQEDSNYSPLLTDKEKYVLEETNKARAKNNLPALTLNSKLVEAARLHAKNMAAHRKMSHVLMIKDQRTVTDRVRYVHYEWSNVGENIAQGYAYKDVVNGWMHSRGHRANILGGYTEIGIGIAEDANGSPYYVQVFAKPAMRRAVFRNRVFRP